jgi:hypothetical protein
MSEVVLTAPAPQAPGRIEPLVDLREGRAQAVAALEAALARRTGPVLKTLERLRDLLTEAACSCDRVLSADAEADAHQLAAPLDGLLALAASHGEAHAQRLLAGARQDIDDARRKLEQQVRDSETVAARTDELQRRNKELTILLQSANARVVELQTAAEGHQREMAAVRQQLAVESAERARLSAQLDNVRTALGVVTQPVSILAAQPPDPDETVSEPAGSRDKGPERESPVDVVTSKGVEIREPVNTDPVLTQYATELLQKVGAAYYSDLESGLNPSQLVERLVGELRRAQDLFAGLAARRGQPKATEFEQCVAELLDSKSSSSFPRHLAIASYATRDTSGNPVSGHPHAERPSVPAPPEPSRGKVSSAPGVSGAGRPAPAAGAAVIERTLHAPTLVSSQPITRRVNLGR